MRKLIATAALIAVLSGCNESGRQGLSKVPPPAKVPTLRPVNPPKNVQALQVKPVQGPSAVRPLEASSSRGPALVQPNTASVKPAQPYDPNSGKPAYRPIDARQAAAQQLLQEQK